MDFLQMDGTAEDGGGKRGHRRGQVGHEVAVGDARRAQGGVERRVGIQQRFEVAGGLDGGVDDGDPFVMTYSNQICSTERACCA